MTTVGITMVRDEEDIIGATVRNMLRQVDAVIVADNLSTDGTGEVLADLLREFGPDRLTVVLDDDPAYHQSEKMTALAARARDLYGADWIVPFDADEWWYSPFGPRLADVLEDLAEQWLVAPATLFDHVAAGTDPPNPDPTKRIRWRRADPAPLPKVACRWRDDLTILPGNHGASYVGGPTIWDRVLVVRHFPYRSVDQFVRKVRNGSAAYRARGDDVPENLGTHWREWGRMLDERGEEALADIFRKWYWRVDPARRVTIDGEKQGPLILDPVGDL